MGPSCSLTFMADSGKEIVGADLAAKDEQTVTPAGERIGGQIDGVIVRTLPIQSDPRGDLSELISTEWAEIVKDGIPYAYAVGHQPGIVKGWVVHELQDDRIAHITGRLRWVLFDGRTNSPTQGMIQEITNTERRRTLMVMPAGVWHAVENVGTEEAIMINFPTRPYDHADPDKRRLPIDSPEIPFEF